MTNNVKRFAKFEDFLKTEIGAELKLAMSDKNNVGFVSGHQDLNLGSKIESLRTSPVKKQARSI